MKRIIMMLVAFGLTIFPLPGMAAEGESQFRIPSTERTVQGEGLIDENKAREALTSFLPWIPEDVKLSASLQDTTGDGVMAWVFEDSRRPGNGFDSFRASIDARNGNLFSFCYHPPRAQYKTREMAFSRDAAYRIAFDYLNKMQGSRTADLEFQSDAPHFKTVNNPFSTDFVFTWVRKLNGIVVNSDGVTIGVDAYTGRINQYWSNWHDVSFPSAEGMRANENIEQDILERLDLYLCYVSEQERYGYKSGNGKLSPIYRINAQWPMFDAYSGGFIDLTGKVISDEGARLFDKDILFKSAEQTGLTESNVSSAPGPESIQQTAKKYMGLLGYTGEVRQAGGGYSGYPGKGQQYLSYAPARDVSSLRVEIDAHTGQFVGFSREGAFGSPGSFPGIDRQKAEEKAREAITRFNPELENQLVLSASLYPDDNRGLYHLSFTRLINGLPFSGQGLFMVIDRGSGEIINYRLNWAPVEIMPHPSLINEEKAKQVLKNSQLLIPCYNYPFAKNGMPGTTPQLVYHLKDILGVDAVSGELLYSPYTQDGSKDGYPARTADNPSLELLHQNGVIMSAVCAPSSPASRRNVIQALLGACRLEPIFENAIEPDPGHNATITDQKDIDLINGAVSSGIIEKDQKIDLNQPISRQEAAVWAVKLLGYRDVAEMSVRVELLLKDTDQISSQYWNYIGIAYGLGLLKEREPAYLCPAQELSWTDLGDLIARFIPLTEAHTAGTGYPRSFRVYGGTSIQMR